MFGVHSNIKALSHVHTQAQNFRLTTYIACTIHTFSDFVSSTHFSRVTTGYTGAQKFLQIIATELFTDCMQNSKEIAIRTDRAVESIM